MALQESRDGIGPKRLVVGANFGVGGFLGQRLTAVVLTAYLLLLTLMLVAQGDLSYSGWAGLFAPVWVKVATMIALAATLYHAWVGVKDIWMDYIKPVWLRLSLQTATALWLLACAVWAAQILWRV
jgi:succinate dehydrogenase / fumarate reductase, membrane anchor subunit